jgi:PDZ domain
MEADTLYPILCPSKCGYNFCSTCVEHLIESSKDDYQEASDGHRAVKIKLQCPQCRGILKGTIEDTFLLRKAKRSEQYRHVPDSNLNSTELRIKHEFLQMYGKEIEHAEGRLRKFQNDRGEDALEKLDLTLPDGDHHCRTDQSDTSIVEDSTLFQGLDFAMSPAEQKYVTVLLTSGNVPQLAQAAQILHGIFQLTLQGTTPTQKTSPVKRAWSDERKQLEQLANYRKLHPLPARMPKFFILTVWTKRSTKTLSFEDDAWDGSIADAFSRANLSKPSPGMRNILSQTEETKIVEDPKPRVKVSAVRGPAGRMGVQKGDVITHVDGERWTGSANDLKELIYRMYEQDPKQEIQFVVNAEESCAEILKLRAQLCKQVLTDLRDL